ncbi:DUF3134 domain-containing protein [Acaryochloris thomasi]|nr:DUF3134 domain-containing protein [Acaryochloris thomasi]
MKNPSLREQPRSQAAPIMESRKDASILGWLENSGRLMEREPQEKAADDEEMEEINALMSGDSDDFEADDDNSDEDS